MIGAVLDGAVLTGAAVVAVTVTGEEVWGTSVVQGTVVQGTVVLGTEVTAFALEAGISEFVVSEGSSEVFSEVSDTWGGFSSEDDTFVSGTVSTVGGGVFVLPNTNAKMIHIIATDKIPTLIQTAIFNFLSIFTVLCPFFVSA